MDFIHECLVLVFKVKSRPEVVCYEGKCICPWGYQLYQNDQKCQPIPGALKSNLGIRPSFEPKSTFQFNFLLAQSACV